MGNNSGLCWRYCCEGAGATGGIGQIKVDDRTFEDSLAGVNMGNVGEVKKIDVLPVYFCSTSTFCPARP